MRNLVVLIVLGALAWFGYDKYQAMTVRDRANARAYTVTPDSARRAPITRLANSRFTCDGRTYCSQMRSCAEATYFIQHCPGTKMDGDNDGVPCEQQWCN